MRVERLCYEFFYRTGVTVDLLAYFDEHFTTSRYFSVRVSVDQPYGDIEQTNIAYYALSSAMSAYNELVKRMQQ